MAGRHSSPCLKEEENDRFKLNNTDIQHTVDVGDFVSRERDSARIHTTVLTGFKGETCISDDTSLTVHGDLIAYAVKQKNAASVRILNQDSKKRCVLKAFEDTPVDVSFAMQSPYLAVVDKSNNLNVYKVDEELVNAQQLVSINRWPEQNLYTNPKISWCPYAPADLSDPTDVCDLLAVFQGTNVYVINLNTIVNKLEQGGSSTSISFDEAKEIDAIILIESSSNATAVRISPDATAVAVGAEDGSVSFFVLKKDSAAFAHCFRPPPEEPITDLFFLDDNSESNFEVERFWRHCVVITNNGRRITVFDCEQWEAAASLTLKTSAYFKAFLDPRGRYLNLLDASGTVLLCLEISYGNKSVELTSLTQLWFHSPIISIYPSDVVDKQLNSSFDAGLEDETDEFERKVSVVSSHISISSKTLSKLTINLEKTVITSTEGVAELQEFTDVLAERPESREPAKTSHNVDDFDEKFSRIAQKLDQLTFQVQRLENEQHSAPVADTIVQLLKQFREEYSLKEGLLLANISDLLDTNKHETITVVRNLLNENAVGIQNSIQINNNQASDTISTRVTDSLANMIVPSLDRTCTQLFKQLNETFRLGMEQYLTQMRAFHQATIQAVTSATPAPAVSVPADRQALLQMIKTRQAPKALETVLNQGEPNAVDFVINHLDPDEFFSNNRLPQCILLSLCQQLTIQIEKDTDLKVRYFEHILERLNPDDRDIVHIAPDVLRRLSQVLTEMQTLNANSALKRPARVLNQIIKSILKTN
ncbi:unnamed protein product [Auanema sp. JU1783]|nr:unnamed protein product [Auanema sp. JU1783]